MTRSVPLLSEQIVNIAAQVSTTVKRNCYTSRDVAWVTRGTTSKHEFSETGELFVKVLGYLPVKVEYILC